MSVLYHPRNANVVADAQSLKTVGNVSHIDKAKKDLVKDLHRLATLGVDWKILRMAFSWFITSMSNH